MDDLLVLCYHAVSEKWRSALSITPGGLERQLRWLTARGYRGVRFGEAVTGACAGGKRVVVTFDDAYRSVLDFALPVLDSLGLPGTVFTPTAFGAGEGFATWDGMETFRSGPDSRELALMSWEDLAVLRDRGWEIGSHSHNHLHLPELPDEALRDELETSRREIELRLGVKCTSLAYPYGDTDARVIAAVARAGYSAAAGLPVRRFHAPIALNWPRVGVYAPDRRWRLRLKTSPTVRRVRAFVPSRRAPNSGPAANTTSGVGSTVSSEESPRVAVIVPCFNDH